MLYNTNKQNNNLILNNVARAMMAANICVSRLYLQQPMMILFLANFETKTQQKKLVLVTPAERSKAQRPQFIDTLVNVHCNLPHATYSKTYQTTITPLQNLYMKQKTIKGRLHVFVSSPECMSP